MNVTNNRDTYTRQYNDIENAVKVNHGCKPTTRNGPEHLEITW